MLRKTEEKCNWDLEPPKSTAAQFLTYVAFTRTSGEKLLRASLGSPKSEVRSPRPAGNPKSDVLTIDNRPRR